MIWKFIFMAIFVVWFLVRIFFAKGVKGKINKGSYYPRSEKFLVALNSITMMLLPMLIVFTPWLDRFAIGLPSWARVAAAVVLAGSVWLFGWTHYCLDNFGHRSSKFGVIIS